MAEPAALPPPAAPDALHVLDISSYVFRAYHALPPLSNSKGEPTHAVAGVSQMIFRLLADRKPHRLAVAWDAPGPTFRKERYAEYKATRKETPPDLIAQLGRVREVVEAWRIPLLERSGFEADDVIATLVRRARAAGLRTVIVSGDKDLLQLVGPDVVMYDTMHDRVFGPDETEAKLGVPPSQVRDLLALMGDSSDNVPGVPSVGAKTAARLLGQYGDLDAIYAHLDDIGGKALRGKLEQFKDQAYLSRDLVTLKDEVDVPFDLDALVFDGGDPAALRRVFGELEMHRLLAQLDPAPAVEGRHDVVTTAAALEDIAARVRDAGGVAVCSVLDRDDPMQAQLVGVALSWVEGLGVYVPLAHRYVGAPDQLSLEDARAVLAPLLENSLVPKYGDAKQETIVWARHGVTLRGVRFDTRIASYVLDPSRHAHELQDVARAELDAEVGTVAQLTGKGRKRVDVDALEVEPTAEVAGSRADYTLRLTRLLEPRFAEGALHALMYDVELPLARVLASIERRGVRIDVPMLEAMSKDVAKQLEDLEAKACELAGHDFNVGSPRQLETILFDELGLPVQKKTKTARSTDVTVLEQLAPMHDLPKIILEHRGLAKLRSTYLDALPREVDPETGRVHTHYNQDVAATGRLSSSEPNLQNIPVKSELGRRIRDAFIPAEGWGMLAADYSQIELRVLAHMSGDEALSAAFNEGADIHRKTASALFDVAPEDVTRAMRGRAKTVNFAVLYGQTKFALARNLEIDQAEAQRYIDAFFARYRGVARFLDEVVERAREDGYVTTLLGRRRPVPDLRSSNGNLRKAAERVARNTPIQGTAADIIKVAMVRIERALERRRRNGAEAQMLLTVHDELVFEAPPGEREALTTLVREEMGGAMKLDVPLVVQVGWGESWGAAK